MNKESFIIIASALVIYSQEITTVDYSPELSQVVLLDDNSQGGSRSFGSSIPNRPVSSMRYLVVSRDEHRSYQFPPQVYSTSYKQEGKTITEKPVEVNLLFRGLYVIEMANTALIKPNAKNPAYTKWRDDKYIATTEGYEPFLKLDDSKEALWKQQVGSNSFKEGSYEKPTYAQEKGYLKTIDLNLTDTKTAVTQKLITSGFKNVIAVGLASRDGNVVPIALVCYGSKRTLYAMYGTFHEECNAKEYGFTATHPGNRIYVSERRRIDDPGWYLGSEYSYMMTGTPYKLGSESFTYDEVLKNKSEIYPRLAWRAGPVHSDLPTEFDSEGRQTKQYFQEYPPTVADNNDNTNPIGCQDCPDQDYYWKMYVTCIKKRTTETTSVEDPSKYVDYRDYLAMNMNADDKTYDPSFYDKASALTPQYSSTDNMPADPYIFDKDGNLLNRAPSQSFDPWNGNVTFFLSWLGWDLGWKVGYSDVTNATKNAMNTLRNLYNTTLAKNPKAILKDTDFLVTMSAGCENTDWYIGSPMERYAPYKNGNEFTVFDMNYLENGGNPFKVTTPKVKRYGSGITNGKRTSFEETAATAYNQKKAAYIHWKWPLIYKDKYGAPFLAGYAEYRYKIIDNSENIMHANQEHNNKNYNKCVSLQGPESAMLKDPVTYDKNSQEYRTDQIDPHDRDARIDRAEALGQIAKKIVVAELLQMTLKSAYALGEKNNIAAAAYEVGAKWEHQQAVKVTRDIIKECLKTYQLWQQSMDAMAKVRDSYRSISVAWDGLLKTTQYVSEYYKTMDWDKINLTNITSVFPQSNLYYTDWAVHDLQACLSDYTVAMHGMALLSDKTTSNNYGPVNRFLNQSFAIIGNAVYESTTRNTAVRNELREKLLAIEAKTGNSYSDQAHLSNVTLALCNIISNQEIRIANERNKILANRLALMQMESRDWVKWQEYMDNGYNFMRDIKTLPNDPKERSVIISNALCQDDKLLFRGQAADQVLKDLSERYGVK